MVYILSKGAHISENNLLITISVRFSYSILENTFVDWQEFNAQHQKQHIQLNIETNKILDDSQENLGANEYYSRLKTLPFGSYQDCIDSVFLSCVWSNLSEDIIYDSDSYSDLNPIRSNDWTITLNTICDKCDMQLTNLLENFIEETKRTISVAQIIGSKEKSQNDTSDEELKKASLNRLASVGSGSKKLDQVYNISTNIVNRAADRMKVLNINDALLPLDKEILDYIMDVGEFSISTFFFVLSKTFLFPYSIYFRMRNWLLVQTTKMMIYITSSTAVLNIRSF